MIRTGKRPEEFHRDETFADDKNGISGELKTRIARKNSVQN